MKPAAYIHTMLFLAEGDQHRRVTLTKDNPWGTPGKDYNEEYPVISVPLPTLDAVLNCYDPQDTAHDYQYKIRKLYEPLVTQKGEPF